MKDLYSVKFCVDGEKTELYQNIKGEYGLIDENTITLKEGSSIDLLTYFNSFSTKKWTKFTTLEKLFVKGSISGRAVIEFVALDDAGTEVIKTITVTGEFVFELPDSAWNHEILGIRVSAPDGECTLCDFVYCGEFGSYSDKKIGVVICTFKREKYVKRTIRVLRNFSVDHEWLSTLVVDNGRSLPEASEKGFRLLHNPNYGGSGGFARGMIERVKENHVDYVLLMDDDIELEINSIDRAHSFLSGLKGEYRDSFLGGAMLCMEMPYVQHENTAYFDKIRIHSCGRGMDLRKAQNLVINEKNVNAHKNRYAAWWFCCIPLERIKEIGYPLPVFVKGDDIEYSVRNNRQIINMNGIGVWHEAFVSKLNNATIYFAERNMHIVHQYAYGCNRFTLFVSIVGRLAKWLVRRNFEAVVFLSLAIDDFIKGLEAMTAVPADEKFARVRNFKSERSIVIDAVNILYKSLYCLWNYKKILDSYDEFRRDNLSTDGFWMQYLKIEAR